MPTFGNKTEKEGESTSATTTASAILLEVFERTAKPRSNKKKSANRVNHHCTNASKQRRKRRLARRCSALNLFRFFSSDLFLGIMLTLHRLSLLTRASARSMISTQLIHIESDANEKVIPLSQFDLSKPLIGRTAGAYRLPIAKDICLYLQPSKLQSRCSHPTCLRTLNC